MLLFAWSAVLVSGPVAHGETIPQLINYKGALTDAGGSPVPDGNYDVQFTIYDAPTAGNILWTEIWDETTIKVIVADGNFNAMLGAYNPIPASFFTDHPVTFPGVTVERDTEMLPRQRITSVRYAFTAGNGVPKRAITMWSGTSEKTPEGWGLYDGNTGIPDLRAKFVLGDCGIYPNSGREEEHTLIEVPMMVC